MIANVPTDFKKIDTLAVCSGGVGTTFVLDFLQAFRQVNDSKDLDGLKHLPFQPLSLNQQLKVLYIYGDPVEAAVSLFLRGYHSTQSVKLSPWVRRAVWHQTSLKTYAQNGHDGLGLERHFRQWYSNPLGYQTLFVDYHQIWENLDAVFNFLDIPKDATSSFTEKKERESSLSAIDIEVLSKLESMYGGLRKTLADIGTAHELSKNDQGSFLRSLGTTNAAMIPYHATAHCMKKLYGSIRNLAGEPPAEIDV